MRCVISQYFTAFTCSVYAGGRNTACFSPKVSAIKAVGMYDCNRFSENFGKVFTNPFSESVPVSAHYNTAIGTGLIMPIVILLYIGASRRMRMCAVRAFREAGSVRCAIVVDPFRVARTYVVSAGAGRCRLAAGKTIAAVLTQLVGRKAAAARFAEMLAPARGARANVRVCTILLYTCFIAAAGTAAADVTQNLHAAAVLVAEMGSPFIAFNADAVDASVKIGIVQTAIQAVAAVGAEFVFFKAIAAVAAAMILRIPVCTFHAYAVVTAIRQTFIKAALRASAAVVAQFIFFKAVFAGLTAVRSIIPVTAFHAYIVVAAVFFAGSAAAFLAFFTFVAKIFAGAATISAIRTQCVAFVVALITVFTNPLPAKIAVLPFLTEAVVFFGASAAVGTNIARLPVAAKTAASAACADSVVFFGAIIAQFAVIVVFIFAAVTFRTVCIRPAILTRAAMHADDAVRNTVDAPLAACAEFIEGFTLVAGGQTLLANDFQTAGKSCTAGLAQFLLRKVSLAVKTSQTGVAVRTNGAVRLAAVFADMTVAADIPAALSAIFAVFVFTAGYTIPALGAVFVFAHIGKAFSAAVAMGGFIAFAVGAVLRTAAAAATAIAVPMVVSAASAVLTIGIVRKCRKRQKRHQHNKYHTQ